MVAGCFVPGCKSKSSSPGISMHRFPSDPLARQSWLSAIHREQGIAKYSDIVIKDEPIDPEDTASEALPDNDDERVRTGVVCSLHFPPNSFYYGNRKHLKPNSVPEADIATYWSNAAQVRKKVKRFRRMGPVGVKMAKNKMFCRKVTVRLPKLRGLKGRTTVRVCSSGETVDDSDSDAWVELPEEPLPSPALSVVPVTVTPTRASRSNRVKYATPAAAKAYQRRFAQSWSNKQQFAHDHGLYATPTLAEVKGRFLRLIESHESLLTRSRDHQTSAQQARNRLAVKKRQLNAKKKEIKELKEKLNALSKGKSITIVTKTRPAVTAPPPLDEDRVRTTEPARRLRPQLVSRCTQTRASDFRARNAVDFDKSTMDSEFSVLASQEGRVASAITPPSKKRPAGWTRWKKIKKPALPAADDAEELAIQDEVHNVLEEAEHRLGDLGPVEDHDDDAINAVLEQTVSDAGSMAGGLSSDVTMEQQPQHPVVLTLEESILAEMMSAGDDVDVPAQLDLSVLQQI